MKQIFQHPPEPETGKKYWSSLDALAKVPAFKNLIEREFPEGAAELNDGVSRRHFLQIMGASSALAGVGLAGCRRPEQHLVPFTRGVEWSIPGKPLFYSSSMPTRNGAIPIIVTTHDGRPTKIEGNPLHPASNGATNAFAQASILNLYDPDRAKAFRYMGEKTDASAFVSDLDEMIKAAAANGGAGLAFLLEDNNSPTRERLRAEIAAKFPKALWSVYEPAVSDDVAAASSAAFGPGLKVSSAFDKADVILAIDSDFLGGVEGTVEGIRAFSSRRRVSGPGDKMNRLYAVENRFTVTGGMADHRLRCPASHLGAFTLELAEKIASLTGDADLKKLCAAVPKPQGEAKFTEGWVTGVAEDLASAKGASLVVAGPRLPAEVQLLVHGINSALGNLGKTVVALPVAGAPVLTITALAKEITAKKVDTLVIVGGNPVYNAPSDLKWSDLQASVPKVVRFGFYEDETSHGCRWQVPAAHYLEYWGDGFSTDGSLVSGQPMILPLFDGWSELDLLARFAGQPKPTGPELIQATFRQLASPSDFTGAWNKFLHDGFLADSAKKATLSFNADAAAALITESAKAQAVAGENAFEVVFAIDTKVDDGRYNNNGWMQELPDVVTKMTWDNAAWISPKTAQKLGLSLHGLDKLGVVEREYLEISFADGRKLKIPAFIAPGHADYSITIPLGYGRTVIGRVGQGTGFDAYLLRTTAQPYVAVGASVKLAGGTYPLAITQDHHAMEGRALVREATVEKFEEDHDFAKKMWMDAELPKGGNTSLYSHPPLDNIHQWGMVVDLNTCTGCNACVTACQAENNTPIVGKEQVINGREMHWMRMDRYFASENETDIEDPEMVTQPMMCQHCENAPCETVCPVNATVHSDDGLNVMAYNRCIGTRYCANNCPFKVRRFNFFDYNQRDIRTLKTWNLLSEKGTPNTTKMQKNPNVTVRMRGVMEKCTYCVQRVQEAKIGAKVKAGATDDVRIPADAFKSACQQACPTEAIVFGDTKNPDSTVSKLKAKERNYRLLEYLNVNTRTSYLARLRNPNPKMPGASKVGTFQFEHEKGGA